MPITSMTGFGSATRAWQGDGGAAGVLVEVRSVNGRHLDVRMRQPFGPRVEHELRLRLEARLGRGRVELAVSIKPAAGGSGELGALDLGPAITVARVDATLRAAAEITARAARAELELSTPNALEVLRFLHSLHRASATPHGDAAVEPPPFLGELVDEALAELCAFRRREGEALATELAGLISTLQQQTASIAALAQGESARWAERVRARVHDLCEQAGVASPEPTRLAQEVAILAAKSDVTEELARIDSHLDRFAETLAVPATPGQGRTLEFIGQELLREVTTIGSKIGSHEAAGLVIDAKGTLERIREQVQNVE